MVNDRLAASRRRLDRINGRAAEGEMRLGKFEERHRRVMVHMENQVYHDLQLLRRRGVSQARAVNEALRAYLDGKLCDESERGRFACDGIFFGGLASPTERTFASISSRQTIVVGASSRSIFARGLRQRPILSAGTATGTAWLRAKEIGDRS